jgi:hypothetical protein
MICDDFRHLHPSRRPISRISKPLTFVFPKHCIQGESETFQLVPRSFFCDLVSSCRFLQLQNRQLHFHLLYYITRSNKYFNISTRCFSTYTGVIHLLLDVHICLSNLYPRSNVACIKLVNELMFNCSKFK